MTGALIYWISLRAVANTSKHREDPESVRAKLLAVQERIEGRKKAQVLHEQ
ncbi:hypothetical protein GLE_5537 [Lysobacter enzymogenes]|uniref:Uncharacterized protein n=1 Tax=Lysobacter enzymogenes TaxID=69 RepID=A0A0S2DQQ1_LYSEN|nr:hypothetical protein GLE_5537 [Lysobacter enzymogenes]